MPRGRPRKHSDTAISERWKTFKSQTELPTSRQFLVRGTWKPDKKAGLKGGDSQVLLVSKTENGFELVGAFQTIDQWNVAWKEWRDIPK